MGFTLTKAVRRAVPMLISLSGPSGSGKTFSGLLLAAGLAGPDGKVGMIDAENGRGSLYADDPDIIAALPNGYTLLDIAAPYTPARYIEAIKEMEQAGITVCVIDSTSHEWEGEGGACDIAENNKLRGMPNWALAKREHKKFLTYCMSSPMHIIFCLRAREKVKVLEAGDIIPGTADAAKKSMVVPMGIQPIAEKNFVFEMLLSLGFDEHTHYAYGIKVPKMLAEFFPGGRLVTKADGARIRDWNLSGSAADQNERLVKRAHSEASKGVEAYRVFFAALTPAQRKALPHEQLKAEAAKADRDSAGIPEVDRLPDPIEQVIGTLMRSGGKTWAVIDTGEKYEWTETQEAA